MIRRLVLFIGFLSISNFSYSQYHLATTFTTKDGLPSNFIYNCLEDSKGFLWIATDQGMSRFDGTRFQLFATPQGLPDIDALKTLKEKNGQIWVRGNNDAVAYFDIIKNKFINYNEDPNLIKLKHKEYTRPFALLSGGIYFPNQDTSYLIKNSQRYSFPEIIPNHRSFIIQFNNDSSEIRFVMGSSTHSKLLLFHTKKNQIFDSTLLSENGIEIKYFVNDGKVYLMNKKSNNVAVISGIETIPLRFLRDTISLTNNYYWHTFTDQYFMALFTNNHVDVYDKKKLNLVLSFDSEELPNSAYNDVNSNFWISTYGKGLFMYQKRKVFNYEFPLLYKDVRYLSIIKKQNGVLLAGNTLGETIESKGKMILHHKRKNSKNTDIIRSIIISQNKIFTFGEGGLYVNYSKQLKSKYNACKVAYALNDSIILCGFLKGMCQVNTKSEKITELNNSEMEVTSFASVDGNTIYFGSTDGLHKYNLSQNKLDTPINKTPLLQERIVAITSNENQIWIATASNGVLVVKDDRLIYHITEKQGLGTNNLLTIANGKKQQIWVGSSTGISIINYSNKIPSIQNISIKDGLTSNVINQFCFQNDTMYAATDNGVSVIPANISIPKFDIPIELTAVKINNVDTLLANYYELNPNQNSIDIEFSGIELSGHFKHAQLSRDEGRTWSDVNVYNLSFQFESGKHSVWLRALDVNGNVGTKILKLQFDIKKHFYEEWWFWFINSLIILIASIYFNTILSRRKHQRNIEKLLNKQKLDEFEIQALKAQINPHFVFNCLNSIRGLIYEEDLEMADLYLQKFSNLLRNTLNYSSKASISLKAELEYIDTYLLMEKLRFENKFEYSIHCDENLNKDRIEIPAMLLQPFVENAINHGVRNLKGVLGIITINIYLGDNFMKVVIDDNGVGRARANEIGQHKLKTHESKGTQITQRRIELHQINLNITDKINEKGDALGTTITLKIPIPLINL